MNATRRLSNGQELMRRLAAKGDMLQIDYEIIGLSNSPVDDSGDGGDGDSSSSDGDSSSGSSDHAAAVAKPKLANVAAALIHGGKRVLVVAKMAVALGVFEEKMRAVWDGEGVYDGIVNLFDEIF